MGNDMDIAAEEAGKSLPEVLAGVGDLTQLKDWFNKNVGKAGWKRLAKELVRYIG